MSDRGGIAGPVMSFDALAALAIGGVLADGPAGPQLFPRRLHEAYGTSVPGAIVGLGSDVDVSFDLAGSADFVRVSVPAVPGNYRVGRVTVAGHAVPGLRSRRIDAIVQPHDAADGDEALSVESCSGRPMFELDVRGLANGPAQVVVSIRRDLRRDIATPALGVRLDALAASLREEAAVLVESGISMQQQLHQADAHARAGTARVEGELQQLAARIDHMQSLTSDLAAQTGNALNDIALAHETALGALRERIDSVHAHVRATGATTTATATAGIDATRNDLAVLRAELQQLSGLVREGMLRRVLKRFGLMPR